MGEAGRQIDNLQIRGREKNRMGNGRGYTIKTLENIFWMILNGKIYALEIINLIYVAQGESEFAEKWIESKSEQLNLGEDSHLLEMFVWICRDIIENSGEAEQITTEIRNNEQRELELDKLYETRAEEAIKEWFNLCYTYEELHALYRTIDYAMRRQHEVAHRRVEENERKGI